MRIYTKIEYVWDGSKYILDKSEFFEYTGPIALACGATTQQHQIADSQQTFMSQAQGQAAEVFGAANTVFNSLVSTFSPTIAAGPNQQGFSPALNAALQSQVITGAGQAYKNAKAAVGNALSAEGGGNVALPSGRQAGIEASLAESAANQTATGLNQLTQENYAVGRENYKEAVAGLERAPGVFSAATGASGAATNAGEAAATSANNIAQADNSWVSAVTGALGAVGGAALGNPAIFAGGKKGGGSSV